MMGALPAILLAGLLPLGTLERPDQDLLRDLQKADDAIERWDVERADAIADRLVARAPELPQAYFLRARVRFVQGRYDDTLTALREASRLSPPGDELGPQARDFEEFVRPLAELAKRFEVEESANFRMHFAPGLDRVLARRGLAALERCYAAVGGDFALRPAERGEKVRVEIFPEAESFEKASTLTKKEIETSGTIALCKFNRLMMLTPRTVLRGFPWCDTLCHEFTHYVLWKRNGPTVPIWLHEAVAKYEEVRWQERGGSELSPLLKEVLKGALDAGKFVTFDAMHPSFAKLKNPHDVALASAEVLSVIRYIMDKGGYPLLRKMLDALNAGSDWRGMFETALGQPFDEFWKEWQEAQKIELKDVKGAEAPERLVTIRDPMRPAVPPVPGSPAPGERAGGQPRGRARQRTRSRRRAAVAAGRGSAICSASAATRARRRWSTSRLPPRTSRLRPSSSTGSA